MASGPSWPSTRSSPSCPSSASAPRPPARRSSPGPPAAPSSPSPPTDDVGPLPAVEAVVPAAAVQPIGPGVAGQAVGAGLAEEQVGAATAGHGVVAGAGAHDVVPVPGTDGVVAVAPHDDVGAGRADEGVVPRRPHEGGGLPGAQDGGRIGGQRDRDRREQHEESEDETAPHVSRLAAAGGRGQGRKSPAGATGAGRGVGCASWAEGRRTTMSAARGSGDTREGRRRRRRWPYWTAGVVLLLVLVFFAGGGWYFSSEIRSDALLVNEPAAPDYRYEVLAAGGGTLTLALPAEPPQELTDGELLGVVWAGGYGQVHAVVARDASSITREFAPLTGTPEPGGAGRLRLVRLAQRPRSGGHRVGGGRLRLWARGRPRPGSWRATGRRGRYSSTAAGPIRGKACEPCPPSSRPGSRSLLITYRNDPGAPEVEGRLARFGATEWEDLEGAVRYALDHGAEDVVLVGYSMGGAIVVSFLLRSDLADEVEAAVLEAPALELGDMVDARAGETSLPLIPVKVPIALTAVAKQIASWRFGVDWGELDLVARAGEVATPMLIIHGTEDDTVPFAVSEEFAAAAPRAGDAGAVRGRRARPRVERGSGAVQAVLAGFLAAWMGSLRRVRGAPAAALGPRRGVTGQPLASMPGP